MKVEVDVSDILCLIKNIFKKKKKKKKKEPSNYYCYT